MLTRVIPARLVGAAALTAALAACANPSRPVLTAANARAAYAVGQRLAAQDRANTAEHRAEMARLIRADIPKTRDAGRTISLYVRLQNFSAKAISAIDAGLEVHDASGRRIGLAEIDLDKTIPPHKALAFWYPMRYLRFGEDAGTMRLAATQPKTAHMEVTEIKYSDGSDAGYDD